MTTRWNLVPVEPTPEMEAVLKRFWIRRCEWNVLLAAAELRRLHEENETLRNVDHIASELQDTCHAQAKRIAEQDILLRQALEALESIGDVYANDDDEAGECASCHERSYRPHAPKCKLANAITAIRQHLGETE